MIYLLIFMLSADAPRLCAMLILRYDILLFLMMMFSLLHFDARDECLLMIIALRRRVFFAYFASLLIFATPMMAEFSLRRLRYFLRCFATLSSRGLHFAFLLHF